MNLHLKNKVIVITDSSSNIKNSIVKVLMQEEAIPVIIGKENNNQKNYFKLSVEGQLTEGYKNIVSSIVNEFGRIDGLVNNIACFDDINIEKDSTESFLQSIKKDIVDCFLLTQYLIPALQKSKGSIVNITFNKSKVNNLINDRTALSREWAVDLLKDEIRVNAVVIKLLNYPGAAADKIANAIVFLLSGKSSHTTGQIINVF